MIKCIGEYLAGGNLIIIGLAEENIRRLKDGQLALFDGRPLGYNGDIIVFYGSTDEEMVEKMRARGVEIFDFRKTEGSS